MKKETKDLLIHYVETWNRVYSVLSVDAHFDDSEFSPEHWALNIAFSGVVCSEFLMYLLPVLSAQNCIWFISGYDSEVILYIQ